MKEENINRARIIQQELGVLRQSLTSIEEFTDCPSKVSIRVGNVATFSNKKHTTQYSMILTLAKATINEDIEQLKKELEEL